MQKQREHWSSQIGFILAAAGSAIGLGTLWKFPYVTGENGGGVFIFFYMLCIFILGIPLFVAELLLGRRAQRGAVGIFASLSEDSDVWKAAGWLGVIASFILYSFYSVVSGWSLNYIFMSLNQFYEGRTAQEIGQIFQTLQSSGDITVFWHFLFTLLCIGVVYPGVRQGVEYWSKFMTSALLVLLVALCAYSVTLKGFPDALKFMFSTDISKFKPSSALEALGLSLFTLSLGQGIMLTYGSYMRRSEDIPKTAAIIGGMIVVISIMAGILIFPIIFTFGLAPSEGHGLVFKTLPVLFDKLPGSLLISTTFFTLFTFTALTSAVAMIEVIVANFMDLQGWSRRKSVLIVGIACFLMGIPSALSWSGSLFPNWEAIYGKNFFATVNDLVSIWLLPIGALMISLFVGWKLDPEASKEEFSAGTKWGFLWGTWFFFMRWVVPVAIGIIILQKTGLVDIDYYLTGNKSVELMQPTVEMPPA